MLVTLKELSKINFPVFVLPSDDWYVTDGVMFMDGMVIDEKNMPSKMLGIRRLQCRRPDLMPLKKVIFDLPALIQCKTKNFIDRYGKPFSYMKTYNSALKSYKLKRVEKKETASLLWLQGIPSPFTVDRPPVGEPEYVRMLHLNGFPWLVYDFQRFPAKDTYRRV